MKISFSTKEGQEGNDGRDGKSWLTKDMDNTIELSIFFEEINEPSE
jgi:hypothetical protein